VKHHAASIGGAGVEANVKAPAFSDTAMTALSVFSIPELFAEEVDRWVAREREARPGVTRSILMLTLARALGLEQERQVYRYMSGETPLPAALLARACRFFRSWRLIQAINQEAGLVAEPKPDVGKLESFDLIVEQSRNLKEFGELVAAYAQATDEVTSEDTYRRLVKEGRDAVQQIERLLAIYGEMVAARSRTP